MYERNDFTKERAGHFKFRTPIFFKKICLYIGLVLSVSACSLDASIQSFSQNISDTFSKVTPAEVVPSSSQGVYTTKGYIVQSSMSYYNAKPEVLTDQGYTVQTNVQSTLFRGKE